MDKTYKFTRLDSRLSHFPDPAFFSSPARLGRALAGSVALVQGPATIQHWPQHTSISRTFPFLGRMFRKPFPSFLCSSSRHMCTVVSLPAVQTWRLPSRRPVPSTPNAHVNAHASRHHLKIQEGGAGSCICRPVNGVDLSLPRLATPTAAASPRLGLSLASTSTTPQPRLPIQSLLFYFIYTKISI